MSELMEKFKAGKIAVNCRTEEAAKKFLKECEDEGLEWGAFNATHHTNWEHYKEETCYTNSMFGLDALGFQRYGFYVYKGIEIIEYKEETKLTTLEMMAALLENPELRAECGRYAPNKTKYNVARERFYYVCEDGLEMLDAPNMMITDWRIIKPEPKEVPVLEVIKALQDGKTVYSIHKNQKSVYKNPYVFIDTYGRAVTLEEITNGKWYIEVQP